MSFLCAGNALHLGTAPLHAENGPGHSDQAHADTRSAAVADQRPDGLRLQHPVPGVSKYFPGGDSGLFGRGGE